jgi:hypothetical protein
LEVASLLLRGNGDRQVTEALAGTTAISEAAVLIGDQGLIVRDDEDVVIGGLHRDPHTDALATRRVVRPRHRDGVADEQLLDGEIGGISRDAVMDDRVVDADEHGSTVDRSLSPQISA